MASNFRTQRERLREEVQPQGMDEASTKPTDRVR
jgi:hypothetical protein